MPASAVRILVTHRDLGVRRRLRQALLGEPDIELLDSDQEERLPDLAERVRVLHPDIIMLDRPSVDQQGRQVQQALQHSPTPARIVLLNGRSEPNTPLALPIDLHLAETASRVEILRCVRQIQAPSSYLSYLPSIFGQDDFSGRFLRIFESVLEPLDQQIDGLEQYADPELAPERFLPWLASWLAVTVDDRWPREQQAALIRAAPELHRWRGTRRGLTEQLRLYLGPAVDIAIEETAGGLRLGPSTQLGLRTVLGESGPRHHFNVTLTTPDPANIDYTVVAALIDAQKPAHCTYSLSVLPATGAALPESLVAPLDDGPDQQPMDGVQPATNGATQPALATGPNLREGA